MAHIFFRSERRGCRWAANVCGPATGPGADCSGPVWRKVTPRNWLLCPSQETLTETAFTVLEWMREGQGELPRISGSVLAEKIGWTFTERVTVL